MKTRYNTINHVDTTLHASVGKSMLFFPKLARGIAPWDPTKGAALSTPAKMTLSSLNSRQERFRLPAPFRPRQFL